MFLNSTHRNSVRVKHGTRVFHATTEGGEIVQEQFGPGCQRPPIIKTKPVEESVDFKGQEETEVSAMIKVGKPAPEFTAPGYHNDKFMNFNLPEFRGKWVLLCFYPGDFTFV